MNCMFESLFESLVESLFERTAVYLAACRLLVVTSAHSEAAMLDG